MEVTKFEKDGQSVWEGVSKKDGKTRFSVAIQTTSHNLDLATGNINTEKSIVWMRSESKDVALAIQEETVKAVKNGLLVPYRAFSETPFYEGQEQDINPSNEQLLGRYSQVRLTTPDKHAMLHRQFVKLEEVVEPAVVEQPAIKLAEAEGAV